MKRLILTLSIITLMLCGCSKKEPVDPSVPEGGYNNSGHRTVLYTGERLIPLAYSIDGESQVKPGIYWYYELEGCLENISTELFQTYHQKNHEPTAERTFEKLKRKKSYAVNGTWPLFCEAETKSYTSRNQDQLSENVKTLFLNALESNGLDKNSGMVNSLWTCDFEGDGENEIFLLGSCGTDETVVLAYIKGENCQLLAQGAEIVPLLMDLNGTGTWSLVLKQEGDYNQFSIYDYKEGNFTLNYQIIY